MTIEELNKIIQEELKAYLNEEEQTDESEEQTDESYMEDGDDDIEVTTDEPDADTGEEAMDLLRQIYDMIKPQVEPEGEEEPEMDMDDEEPADEEPADDKGEEEEVEENFDRPNYKASDVQDAGFDAEKIKGGLNESVARFQKLANIKG